ncbi:MAG: hypothetical protein R3Y36_01855 [Spirochaetales bacterium]
MNQTLDTHINVKISTKEKQKILAHAKLQGFTSSSEYVRNAVTDYMNKDIAWQAQVQGAVESLRADVKRIDKSLDLFSLLFIHFTEYYFTYTKSLSDLSNQEKVIRLEDGRKRSKTMINSFKKTMKNKPRLIEMLLADFYIEQKEEE